MYNKEEQVLKIKFKNIEEINSFYKYHKNYSKSCRTA